MASVPRWFSIATRALFALLAILTSLYCLLAYVPDTYFAFIQAPFQPWIVDLIHFHPYFFLAALGLLGTALLAEHKTGRPRRLVVEFIVFYVAVAVFTLFKRPFSHLENSSLSFLWGLVSLSPLIWIGVIDRLAQWQAQAANESSPPLQVPMRAAALAGLGMGLLYPGSSWLRYKLAGQQTSLVPDDFLVWAWAVVVQFLFAICVVALFNLVAALASRVRSQRLRFFCYALPAAVAVSLIFERVLLASIPLIGLEAKVYSAVMAVALVLFCSGIWTLIAPYFAQSATVGPPTSWREAPQTRNAGLIVVLLAACYTVPGLIGVMDWNSVLAKLWSAILWLMVIAVLARIFRPKTPVNYPVWLLLVLCVGSFAVYRVVQRESLWPDQLRSRENELATATARHAVLDASFQTVRDFWATTEVKPCDPFCQFLREQTNIPAFINVHPVDVKLAELQPATGPKPNIFIFTVDSLRRDYISAYNPKVTFTPQIGEFANESVVLHNSFTRYAGTTLSEPAIWAGSMLLHKHYVLPFHPLNNLEKMLDVDGYDRFVTVDTVLRRLLDVDSKTHKLDSTMTDWAAQDLCTTAAEAEHMIDQRADKTRPIFLYTQPQNIHVVALYRASAVRPPQSYPGFYAPAATELKRLDGCFGNFIHYLKSRGLYDNSIVVLTADHGESYGEAGHKNHAFGLYPEVLRIPLIIHLPKSMQGAYYHDPEAPAFNVDITPSIYYLLGHRPIANDPKFGRPLFTLTKEENQSYQRSSYLVVVCYGPVYGILGGKGENLFVANEMDSTYQYYDLVNDPFGANNLANTISLGDHQHLLRSDVQNIADFYHYRYHTPTLINWMMR